MTAFVDGGRDEPAFPVTNCAEHQFCGMSLRDYFAAKAMQSLSSRADDAKAVLLVCEKAYCIADAMLKARAA